MVESRSGYPRSSRPAYLIFLVVAFSFFTACSKEEPEATIVELQFTSTENVLSTVEKTLPKDIEFTTTENKFIFFADQNRLKGTLKILASLDKAPTEYKLYFRPSQPKSVKSYSTTRQTALPMQSLRVSEGETAKVESTKTILFPFFESATKIKLSEAQATINKLDNLNSKLTLKISGTQKGINKSYSSSWVIPHNRWQKISPQITEDGLKRYSTAKRNPIEIEVKVTPAKLN